MKNAISGIHHITALASDPQRNLDFYVRVLGLRMVKQTVNFDLPDVYHFYYGDEVGTPGTLLTFFPFPGAGRGKRGIGEVSSVAFSVPPAGREYWIGRLAQHGIPFDGPLERFDDELIAFHDPDGMQLELVFIESAESGQIWKDGPVPVEFALRRFHGVTLTLGILQPTASLLTDTMGFRILHPNGDLVRFLAGTGNGQAAVDICIRPTLPPARQSAGSVHHIAWRVPDDSTHRLWQKKIADTGLPVTEIVDRQYFHSIYYNEPGGVLFEIATDPPGFLIDESKGQLGTRLKLPPWLEPQRKLSEQLLPPVSLPGISLATIHEPQEQG